MSNTKQKKLIIVTPYPPLHGGGLEKYAYEEARYLASQFDWEVIFITSGDCRGKDTIEAIDGMKVYKLSYAIKLSNTPFSFNWFGKIKKILKDEKPDILNVHSPVPGIGNVAALYAHKKTPTVITYHTGSLRKGSILLDPLIWVYEHTLLRYMLSRADCVVATSDFLRQGFLKRYMTKGLTITPATDTEVFRPEMSKKAKNPSLFFAAGISRSEQHKGLRTLIDAIYILKKDIPDIRLTVAGGGDMRGEYEDYARALGLHDAITFTGRIEGEALVSAYQAAHIFVLPTSIDNFPTVIVEAMSCGLPIVSTEVGGIPELVKEGATGYLVKPHDPAALAQKIKMLLDSPKDIELLGKNARLKMVDTHGWDNRAYCYDALFSKLSIANLKLVQVAPYYPPHLGGLERVAQEVAEQLTRNGNSVTVLTSNIGAKDLPVFEVKDTLKIKRLRSFEFAHTPIIPGLLWQLLQTKKPAVFHLHLAQVFVPETIWLASKLRGIRYVVHFHLDVEPSGTFGFIFVWWKRWILPIIIRGAAHVITLSPEQSKLIIKRYGVPVERVTFIGNGVGEQFLEIGKTKRTFHKPLRLLFVGRMSLQKRPERLIEAMSMLKNNVELVMVGDGEDRAKHEALATKLGLKNITFRGALFGDELLEAYRGADVFVLPSDREGMPLVLLEAMATGLPIVASDVLGITELIDGVGVLVPNPSPETFAKAIDELAANPRRLEELSEASYTKAKQYSWAELVARLEREVYTKIQR